MLSDPCADLGPRICLLVSGPVNDQERFVSLAGVFQQIRQILQHIDENMDDFDFTLHAPITGDHHGQE